MKRLLRYFLINLASLFLTTRLVPGLMIDGGFRTLAYAALVFMMINFLIVPVLKLMFLPLNLLTLGIFSWIINVLALYLLTTIVPQIKLVPFFFPGYNLSGFSIPAMELNVLYVAIFASFVIGFTSHIFQWLID